MNNFQTASIKSKEYMTELLKTQGIDSSKICFTSEKGYKRYDGTYQNSKGKTIIFEIKVRNVASFQYPTTVIEQSKYDFLINEHKRSGVIPFIFIFFTDGKVLIQNLLGNSVTAKEYYAPRTTAGDNTRVIKKFMEFPINSSNTYSFNISK